MQQKNNSLIYGIHPVEEALDANLTIEKVFIRQGLNVQSIRNIINHCREFDIPYVYTPQDKLNQFTKQNHQGVIAFISPVNYVTTDDIVNIAFQKGEDPLIIICDSITDVRNLGAIARSAYCSGVHGIIVPTKSSALLTEEVVKSSAGTILHLPIARENSLSKSIEQLKLSGLKIFATDMTDAIYVHEADYKIPCAIIMGAEGEGVSKNLLQLSDGIIKLPMIQGAESYNVSVAAGMILYEVMKQRNFS